MSPAAVAIVKRAAARDRRTVSQFLAVAGIDRAREALGLPAAQDLFGLPDEFASASSKPSDKD